MTRIGNSFQQLDLGIPVVQAPMAGVSTPEMAAAVTNAGGLGSIAVGASTVDDARTQIQRVKALSSGVFNVNVFCHKPALRDPIKEQKWLDTLKPEFARFGASAPNDLSEIYQTFLTNDAMHTMLLEECPRVISFHFGLPRPDQLDAIKNRGIMTFATATNPKEALEIEAAGIDVIVAQGWEAGGHRGCFDENSFDSKLGTLALTRILTQSVSIPVIAAGGIMDGSGIRAALGLGAVAAQLGTAFVTCDESKADATYRARFTGEAASSTVMTRAISGRPARCLANKFTAWAESRSDGEVPDYPVTYDAGKALNSAAKAQNEHGFGAQWAGQGAPLARPMTTAKLMQTLATELAG